MYKFYYTIIRNGTVIADNQMCYAECENELEKELKELFENCFIVINS